MNKEFAPYQPSLDMKELGFDEPCIAFYSSKKELYPVMQQPAKGPYFNNGNFIETIRAPLYQQAFRWFREKYGLHVIIDEEIRPQIKDSNGKLLFEYTKDGKYAGFEYEEAELACLIKLIEIVKNK